MRNKIFAILIPLLFVCLGASAQIGEHRSELSIGVTGGMSMNSIDFDPTIKQKSLMAFTGGIAMRYTCEKYFSTVCALQIELNYTQLGWKEDISSRAGEPLPDKYTISSCQCLPVWAGEKSSADLCSTYWPARRLDTA